MIFGGTAIQTLILAIITMRCDWDKEVTSPLINAEAFLQYKKSLCWAKSFFFFLFPCLKWQAETANTRVRKWAETA